MTKELVVISGSTILVIALAGVFIAVGLFMLYRLIKNMQKANQSKTWMTTPGKVLFSDVDVQYSTNADDEPVKMYQAKVIYQYDVFGMHYEKDRIAFNTGMRSSNFQNHAAMAATYPAGNTVTVYYNPDDPEDAVLETKVQSPTTNIFIALVMIAIGLVIIITTLNGS